MDSTRLSWLTFAFCATACVAPASVASAPVHQAAPLATAHDRTLRDGSHDFDFHFGTWRTHISRLVGRAGAARWLTLDGTVAVRKIWNGRANLEEVEAHGSGGHFSNLGLFVYDPLARQWSISFAGSDSGTLSSPPSVGEFRSGRGVFFDQEVRDGQSVLVRILWSRITADSHRFEEAFSSDGGKTWQNDFIASLTRARERTAPFADARFGANAQHAFDFARGVWREHTSRLLHPLSGSKDWTRLDGVAVDSPIWNGRANLVEVESHGPSGRLELLSLRLFDPVTRLWNLYFATAKVGIVSGPMTGAFRNGRGEFYSQDIVDGRTILVRFRIIDLSPTTARSEQAFSTDAGATWETNWINTYVRA